MEKVRKMEEKAEAEKKDAEEDYEGIDKEAGENIWSLGRRTAHGRK